MDPLRELELLLLPIGMKTVSAGAGAMQAFLDKRYGPDVEKTHRERIGKIRDAKVVLLGMPCDNGAGFERGSKKGPLGIRCQMLESGTYEELEGLVDIGDVRDHPILIHDSLLQPWVLEQVRQERWGEEGKELPVSPQSILERCLTLIHQINPQAPVLMLGGDHSHSLVPVQALWAAGERFAILHIDAHTDLLETRDGLAYSYSTWAYHANDLIGRKKRFIQVGVRNSGRGQDYWEKTLDLVQIRPKDCTLDNILTAMEQSGCDKWYISNDIDAVCSSIVSATGTPEPEGLKVEFIEALIKEVGKRYRIIGSDLMEVAPPLTRGDALEPARTLGVAIRFLKAQFFAHL